MTERKVLPICSAAVKGFLPVPFDSEEGTLSVCPPYGLITCELKVIWKKIPIVLRHDVLVEVFLVFYFFHGKIANGLERWTLEPDDFTCSNTYHGVCLGAV